MSAALVAMAAAAVEAELAERLRRRGRLDRARRSGGWAIILAAVGLYAFLMRVVFG